jgi:ribosomal protein S18 acetylase RimI-like enzyme
MSEQYRVIRSAGAQDIATVLDLWAATGSVPTVSDSPDGLAGLLAIDPQALLVAEVDGVLVGSLIATWDGWRGSFYRLAVAPEHRRKGLATMLLREAERHLRERGAIRLTAIVADDEENAMPSGAQPAMSVNSTGRGLCVTSRRSAGSSWPKPAPASLKDVRLPL